MIKNGNNPAESKQEVNKHYGTVRRIYPEASVSKLAELVKVFAGTEQLNYQFSLKVNGNK